MAVSNSGDRSFEYDSYLINNSKTNINYYFQDENNNKNDEENFVDIVLELQGIALNEDTLYRNKSSMIDACGEYIKF